MTFNGQVMETSMLTVKGGVKSSDPTTGIIVIAVVCCVVGTSLGELNSYFPLLLNKRKFLSVGIHNLPNKAESKSTGLEGGGQNSTHYQHRTATVG